jgi:hypothetical protein
MYPFNPLQRFWRTCARTTITILNLAIRPSKIAQAFNKSQDSVKFIGMDGNYGRSFYIEARCYDQDCYSYGGERGAGPNSNSMIA